MSSYDSVATPEGGEAIVNKAVESFGRLDIVINKRRDTRDKTLAKMEPAECTLSCRPSERGQQRYATGFFEDARERIRPHHIDHVCCRSAWQFRPDQLFAAKLGLVGMMKNPQARR